MIDKLLSEVSAINQKYALVYQKTGAYFNIFDIAGISSDEVVICKLICELLDSNGSHSQGDAFLRLFIRDVLKLDFTELDYLTARVHKEYYAGRRRIDLCIISVNYMIPIEVKIFAGDQDEQCFDYAKTRNNSDLYYLTLDGRLPGENSVGSLTPVIENDVIVGYEGMSLLSFSFDIINWINKCLALPETIRIAPIREILLQFKDIMNKLTGQTEGGAKMDIVNTLTKSAENMKSAIEIAGALSDAKASVMLDLFRELKRLFEHENRNVYDYDEDSIRQCLTTRAQLFPCISVEIKKLEHNLTATLCIIADLTLYYSFALTEVDTSEKTCEFVEIERVKSDYPDVYEAFLKAVTDVVGTGESTENEVYWEYILDDKGRPFDFKTFSPSCVDLTANYYEPARKIFDKLNSLIAMGAERLK
jgi:hypothetical protein